MRTCGTGEQKLRAAARRLEQKLRSAREEREAPFCDMYTRLSSDHD